MLGPWAPCLLSSVFFSFALHAMSVVPCFLRLALQCRGASKQNQHRNKLTRAVKSSIDQHALSSSYAAVHGPVGDGKEVELFDKGDKITVPISYYHVFVDAVPEDKLESFAEGVQARLSSLGLCMKPRALPL